MVMREDMELNARNCIHCHLCQKNCSFLKKYKLDMGDTTELQQLAYHCFLCGKCTQVCPKGIDGREIMLGFRRQQVRENRGKLWEKGYGMLLLEKQNYLFKNYRNIQRKSVIFPGCNFPAFYPETTRYLSHLLKKEAGISTVFDCCGKPIAELGMEKREKQICESINRRLEAQGVEEVIMLCPNCYVYLKPILKVKVVSIYEKLMELGLGKLVEEEVLLFPPCPDRNDGEMLEHISPYLVKKPELITKVQCCGLGGSAAGKEPELVTEMLNGIEKSRIVYTYCASCTANLIRKGHDSTGHILLEILGRSELPDLRKSVLNRLKMRYWRE